MREDIYSALFDILETTAKAAGAKTCSRKLRHWSDVPAAEQPAVFQIQRTESSIRRRGVPAKTTLNVDFYIYVNTSDDPQLAPTTLLNPILDAIDNAFPSEEPGGPVTLDGLVSHVWTTGNIETAEGVLGSQEVAIVPIEIITGE
jgi:hypothetical protein